MPQYALLTDHSPDLCPASNAKTRARMLEGLNPENAEKVAQSLGMNIVFGPVHLDPSHRTLAVIEAPAIEAVNQWVIETHVSVEHRRGDLDHPARGDDADRAGLAHRLRLTPPPGRRKRDDCGATLVARGAVAILTPSTSDPPAGRRARWGRTEARCRGCCGR